MGSLLRIVGICVALLVALVALVAQPACAGESQEQIADRVATLLIADVADWINR